MNELFHSIGSWHWVGFAAIAFLIEVLSGTGFLLWIGISSVLVGILLLIFHSVSLGAQLLVFSVLSILTALLWKVYLHYHPIQTDDPTLNRRAEQYIGREFTLQAPIINGMSKVRVDDSMWLVKCNEALSDGAHVKVIGADGVILLVEGIE